MTYYFHLKTVTVATCKFTKRFPIVASCKMSMSMENCALHKNFTYYAGIMHICLMLLLKIMLA